MSLSKHSEDCPSEITLFKKTKYFAIPCVFYACNGREYTVGDFIACGGNAVVHECVDSLTGDIYAIKFQLELKGNRKLRFEQEVSLLKRLDDPHIIKYIADGNVDGFFLGFKGRRQRQSMQIPYVIFPRASSSLSELVRSAVAIPAAQYLGQFLGLVKALAKINCIAVHRDIKPENLLIVGDRWVISDFGLCDVVEVVTDLDDEDEKIGPVFWMSPEALNKFLGNQDEITEAADVFQLASVFWYVVCGRHPHGNVHEDDWVGPSMIYGVMKKALMHSKEKRFQTSAEFLIALSEEMGMP